MPFYEYVCTACGTRVEVMHGVNESGPAVCMACGGSMRKAMSAPAIVFKGSGWAKKERAGSGRRSDTDSGASDGESKQTSAKSSDGGKSADGGKPPDGGKPADSSTAEPAKGGGGSSG